MKKQFIFLSRLNSTSVYTVKTEKNTIIERYKETRLEALQNSPQGRICVVLPDHMVSTFELNISTRNQSQLNKVARFAVEEKFPGRLEDYHIVSSKASSQSASVRAVKHTRLAEVLKLLSQYDISPDEIIVESDLLNKNISTLIFNDKEVILCGETLNQTYEFDRAVVPLITDKLITLLNDSKDLQIIHAESDDLILKSIENQMPDTVRIKKIIKNERYYESLCATNNAKTNLLQAEYKTTNQDLEKNSLWKYPIYLAAASIFTFTAGLYAQNIILNKKNVQSENDLIEKYTQLFPQASKPRDVIDLSIKLKNKTNNNTQIDNKVLPIDTLLLLEKSSSASQSLGLEFQGLSIDKNLAEILVAAKNIENLNAFKEKIAEDLPGLTVSLDSVTSIDNKYQGKIRIK